MTNKPTLATQAINAGDLPAKNGNPFREGPQFASTFHLAGEVDPAVYQYGRFNQPTWHNLETGLAQLEGGDTIIFPSGLSAAAAILTSLVEPGQTILLPNDGYTPVRVYAEKFLQKFGVHIQSD